MIIGRATPVTVAMAHHAMLDGEDGFTAMSPQGYGEQAIFEIAPIRCRTSRTMFWVTFSDGRQRIMDGRATVYQLRRAA